MSPQLLADNLLRIRIDTLSIELLQEHAHALRNVLMVLAEGLASPTWSAPARYGAMHLIKRIAFRLDETLSLIDDRRCEQAEQSKTKADANAVALDSPSP